ncbi:MAG: L-serine ammonia-lyase, iron-sulfur-dependent, subunit alpha [Acholeplasmatales bacterium]|jgi:L-serine dehydratase|nr:L-serine ammonia-lyase, iron-sulfur-dependent, subunit alpha [Acholeplasmatales bacterium]
MISIKNLFEIGYGPSSSHTIGPAKAALYVKEKYTFAVYFKIILYNSLNLTGEGHATKESISRYLPDATYELKKDNKKHPNLFYIIPYDSNMNELDKIEFISVGGGLLLINGSPLIENDVYKETNFKDIKNYCINSKIGLYEYITKNEGDLSYMDEVFDVMISEVRDGLKKDGLLPGVLKVSRKAKALFLEEPEEKRNLISAFAYAASEENASSNLIVTAPTCGACGVIPAIVYYLYNYENVTRKLLIEGLIIAGLIGNIIRENATISGAVGGCQAEIGSATAMASAMLTYINSGTLDMIECAAEISIEHSLGLTCDPVRGYVQIPCIERNVLAALRALDCASLAKSIYKNRKISLDTIIKTMYQTGKDLKAKYRETSLGGLALNWGDDEFNCW